MTIIVSAAVSVSLTILAGIIPWSMLQVSKSMHCALLVHKVRNRIGNVHGGEVVVLRCCVEGRAASYLSYDIHQMVPTQPEKPPRSSTQHPDDPEACKHVLVSQATIPAVIHMV